MENILIKRISDYNASSKDEYVNSIREVVQELTLFALSKTDFFSKAAFLGGTALRIFYGLDRASEDLNFSLIEKDEHFSLDKYLPAIEKIFKSFGLTVSVTSKKSIGAVQSAFVKSNTITNLVDIGLSEDVVKQYGNISSVKVKIEIDTNPPSGATHEYKYGLFPSPYKVLVFNPSSLFAGKLYAILCRDWVKGRDYYDYAFYLQNNIKPNLALLKNSLLQTKYVNPNQVVDEVYLKERLLKRFDEIDYEIAKQDCKMFVYDKSKLDIWSADFFKGITTQYFKA